MRFCVIMLSGLLVLGGASSTPAPVLTQSQARAVKAPQRAAKSPSAVPLKVEGDTVLIVRSFDVPVTITAPKGSSTLWSFPDVVKATKRANVLTVTGAPKGRHRITALTLTIDFDKKEVTEDSGEVDLIVGDIPPEPGPGPGPGPGPTPVPPGPVTGLRVLMVRETEESLRPGQYAAWYSPKVRDYLNAKCKDGAKGWRRWDKDINTDREDDVFKQLWKDTKPKLGALPVLVLVSDQRGEVVPFPETEEAVLTLLQEWGGK